MRSSRTKRNVIRYAMGSDATILVFGIRYDIDTILPQYRDIDTIYDTIHYLHWKTDRQAASLI